MWYHDNRIWVCVGFIAFVVVVGIVLGFILTAEFDEELEKCGITNCRRGDPVFQFKGKDGRLIGTGNCKNLIERFYADELRRTRMESSREREYDFNDIALENVLVGPCGNTFVEPIYTGSDKVEGSYQFILQTPKSTVIKASPIINISSNLDDEYVRI